MNSISNVTLKAIDNSWLVRTINPFPTIKLVHQSKIDLRWSNSSPVHEKNRPFVFLCVLTQNGNVDLQMDVNPSENSKLERISSVYNRDGAREGCPRAFSGPGSGIQQNSDMGWAAGARSIHGPVTGAREKPGEATRATFILMTLLKPSLHIFSSKSHPQFDRTITPKFIANLTELSPESSPKIFLKKDPEHWAVIVTITCHCLPSNKRSGVLEAKNPSKIAYFEFWLSRAVMRP